MAPKVRPIPAVLPTLKADLQVMCRLHGLAETGTIAELTDRLETTRDGTDEEGEEWPEELEKMRMADLRALAKKLGVDPAGTKSELIEKIKEARDGDPTAKAGVKAHGRRLGSSYGDLCSAHEAGGNGPRLGRVRGPAHPGHMADPSLARANRKNRGLRTYRYGWPIHRSAYEALDPSTRC
jgi:hypothetical protein